MHGKDGGVGAMPSGVGGECAVPFRTNGCGALGGGGGGDAYKNTQVRWLTSMPSNMLTCSVGTVDWALSAQNSAIRSAGGIFVKTRGGYLPITSASAISENLQNTCRVSICRVD